MYHDVEFFKIQSSVVLPCLNWNTQSETSGTEQREMSFKRNYIMQTKLLNVTVQTLLVGVFSCFPFLHSLT